ncbi:MAG: hypothetical protein FWB78_04555 [Treponema sp.]|nr:hypothetical protein [Treponema sp.]
MTNEYQRHGERDGTVNVYDFIRSRDVAEHCRKIGRVWNTFEMAVIIARSLRPMDEKHEARRALIDRHPDMPAPPNVHRTRFDSLHKKLAEIIDYEERAVALFKKPEPGAVTGTGCAGATVTATRTAFFRPTGKHSPMRWSDGGATKLRAEFGWINYSPMMQTRNTEWGPC